MIEKLKEQAEKNPNNIAYIINDEKISYKELYDKAMYYSNYLKNEGTSPVIIYGNKELNVLISMISCIMAKRTYINIDYNTPLDRLKKIIELIKPTLVISNNSIDLDGINCHSLESLEKYKNENIKINKNNNIYIIFTSGTTGIPKGVPINENNLNNFIDWISNLEGLNQYKNIKILNTASFSFDLSVSDIFYSLCNGHTLIGFNKGIDNVDYLLNVLKDIDMVVLTPTFLKFLLLNNDFNSKNYPKLKCIYSCGEELETKVAKKILEAFFNINLINAYGPTEATSAVSGIKIKKEMLNNKLLPVGDINNLASNIEILNNEIVIKGKSVFEGYLFNNNNCYKENGINCYKTGDLGYIENNMLYITGRIDNQIKYKGYRIELNEIEYYINQIDGVKDVIVIPKYNNRMVKLIKAFIIREKDIDNNYIKKELKKILPSYMIPKSIVFLEKFPINKNGKIDRKALNDYD